MTSMATQNGVETEIKLPVSNIAATRRKLRSLGFEVSQPRSLETNTLYDAPDGRLRQSRQLIRLRSYRGRWILTYKGPGSVTPNGHRARPELECGVSQPEPLIKILSAAGLAATLKYEKYRTEFRKPRSPGTALLDETPVGNFLELEGPASWIDRTAQSLGYTPADYIASSYLTLYFNDCRKKGFTPADMLFENSRRNRVKPKAIGKGGRSNSRRGT